LILNTSYIFNKEKIKMEYIIGLAVLVVLGYVLFRMVTSSADEPVVEHVTPTPTPVVEVTPAVETPASVVVEAPAPVVEDTPVVEAPTKQPRKPRAPKVVAEKPAVKKAAPVKKAAAIKAAPKKTRSKKA